MACRLMSLITQSFARSSSPALTRPSACTQRSLFLSVSRALCRCHRRSVEKWSSSVGCVHKDSLGGGSCSFSSLQRVSRCFPVTWLLNWSISSINSLITKTFIVLQKIHPRSLICVLNDFFQFKIWVLTIGERDVDYSIILWLLLKNILRIPRWVVVCVV